METLVVLAGALGMLAGLGLGYFWGTVDAAGRHYNRGKAAAERELGMPPASLYRQP